MTINSDIETDREYMRIALDLAKKVKGRTFPNPAVGAVIVKGGTVIGRGATARCGGPHAEILALRGAGSRSKHATLYVTLEPCCHFGRTPPCTDSIKAAQVDRVVVAVQDPNPLVRGKGLTILRKHGIDVTTGVLREEATELNEDFFWAVTRHRAWVTLKLAMTLDGRIADENGNSKWITSPQSRKMVQELRRCHAGVAVGRATLDLDNPSLTVRHKRGFNPARIVFTSSAAVPKDSNFFKLANKSRTIIVTPGHTKRIFMQGNLEIWDTGRQHRRDIVGTFLEMAFEEGLTGILVEGGQNLASLFLENGFVNRLCLFYGNAILGRGKTGLLFEKGRSIDAPVRLKKTRICTQGADVMVSGLVDLPPERSKSGKT